MKLAWLIATVTLPQHGCTRQTTLEAVSPGDPVACPSLPRLVPPSSRACACPFSFNKSVRPLIGHLMAHPHLHRCNHSTVDYNNIMQNTKMMQITSILHIQINAKIRIKRSINTNFHCVTRWKFVCKDLYQRIALVITSSVWRSASPPIINLHRL